MGLDMYLEADLYISDYPGGQNHLLKEPLETLLLLNGINGRGLKGMTFEVGYWRKANTIHGWFVKNVQNGEDNCQRTYVSFEDLRRLKHECLVVLTRHHRAGEEIDEELEGVDLLPPTAGFFFGGTEKDEGYYHDLERTVKIIDKALGMDERLFDFYYRASW